MLGAILGDMIGAPYEFDRGDKTKNFPLFSADSEFTDDSVMTIAVAEALLDASEQGVEDSEEEVKALLVQSMRSWGKRYPNAGYGGRFIQWLFDETMGPYNSFGNGSAMRVASAGWLYDNLKTTRKMARWTAEVTHNHAEGVKGAEATASAIFLARHRVDKELIKTYIIQEFGYDLSSTCDEIRPGYYHNESCQKTVPEAITAFMEGNDFEDVIRTAVSLGGDCDTLTCIAGSMAEAFYGIPAEIMDEGLIRLTEEMKAVVKRFYQAISEQKERLSEYITDESMTSEEMIEKLSHRLRELSRNDDDRKEVTELLEHVLKMAEEAGNKEEIIKNLNNMILEYLR